MVARVADLVRSRMGGRFLLGGEDGASVGGPARCWLVRGDCCSYFSVLIVWLATAWVDFSVTRYALVPLFFNPAPTVEGWIHVVAFQLIILLVFFCHFMAMFSDPGLVPKDKTDGVHESAYYSLLSQIQDSRPGDARILKKLFCKKCKIPKPKGAHHCSTCERCIYRLDHHCPWVNNCVGERNVKAFVLFLCWVALGTSYSLVMFAVRGYQIYLDLHAWRISKDASRYAVFHIGAVVLSIIFCIFFLAFVLFMLYDQYEAATTGLPGIDALQNRSPTHAELSVYQGCKEYVFFEPFGMRWFVPLPSPVPVHEIPPPPGSVPRLPTEPPPAVPDLDVDTPQSGTSSSSANALGSGRVDFKLD